MRMRSRRKLRRRMTFTGPHLQAADGTRQARSCLCR
jgi:hypothetical protein